SSRLPISGSVRGNYPQTPTIISAYRQFQMERDVAHEGAVGLESAFTRQQESVPGSAADGQLALRHLAPWQSAPPGRRSDQPSATSHRDGGDSPTRPGAHPRPATMRDESAFLTTQTDKKKPFSQSFRRTNMIP